MITENIPKVNSLSRKFSDVNGYIERGFIGEYIGKYSVSL
jgi:hypothetical protein